MNQGPIDKLLALGEESARHLAPDYLALGLDKSHIPELTRIARQWVDEHDDDDDYYMQPAAWAPIHAMRALGQLRATESIDALLALLPLIDDRDDDWLSTALPEAFGQMGAAIIPVLAAYLNDGSHGLWARCAASEGLELIGQGDANARAPIIETMTRQLEHFADQEPELNASLIHVLLEFKAVSAVPLIEQAYAADRVDLMYQGDWEDAQIELGLKEKRDTPPPGFFMPHARGAGTEVYTPANYRRAGGRSATAKDKAKRKQAKKSRQKNRRKR